MKKTGDKPTVIFVCEHGAAKSIIAAAYFNKIAHETGLDQWAIARGTNPDPDVSPKALAGLLEDGLTPTESIPQRLSSEDLQTAHQVVTFCKLGEEYRYEMAIEYWDDVPPVSEDYETARDVILAHVTNLIKNS
jgi:arsenate reductase (thioredoxin)